MYISVRAALRPREAAGGVWPAPALSPRPGSARADAPRHVTPPRGGPSSLPAVRLYGRRRSAAREGDGGGGGGSVKMAAAVRQDLAQLMNSSGSHKDLAGK